MLLDVCDLQDLQDQERSTGPPFGVNQPGPYVMYTSVDSNGYLKNASAKSHHTSRKHFKREGRQERAPETRTEKAEREDLV
ncbi:hypothetical protein SRHO_G00303890 [Serrasalmus rhombeus]